MAFSNAASAPKVDVSYSSYYDERNRFFVDENGIGVIDQRRQITVESWERRGLTQAAAESHVDTLNFDNTVSAEARLVAPGVWDVFATKRTVGAWEDVV